MSNPLRIKKRFREMHLFRFTIIPIISAFFIASGKLNLFILSKTKLTGCNQNQIFATQYLYYLCFISYLAKSSHFIESSIGQGLEQWHCKPRVVSSNLIGGYFTFVSLILRYSRTFRSSIGRLEDCRINSRYS